MNRRRWFEIHDQPWFPAFLRDRVTEALEGVWNQNHTYRPIAARLRAALESSRSRRIVDLCSGGGGPWPGLYADVAGDAAVPVCLTDVYPNALVLHRADELPLRHWRNAVDARQVPAELDGFRTMFSSFHHFDPDEARRMLADAFQRREGIGVFEGARCNPWTLLTVAAMPILGIRAALTARPVQWSRIFWTCVIPVVPLLLWVDGILSCLRSYSLEDLRELTAGLSAPDYEWQIGDEKGGPVPIRYLIGTRRQAAETSRAHLSPAVNAVGTSSS